MSRPVNEPSQAPASTSGPLSGAQNRAIQEVVASSRSLSYAEVSNSHGSGTAAVSSSRLAIRANSRCRSSDPVVKKRSVAGTRPV